MSLPLMTQLWASGSHEKVARSDPRRLAFAAGPMQRTKLADLVVVADFEITPFATELYVLRLTAHDGMFKNAIPAPSLVNA